MFILILGKYENHPLENAVRSEWRMLKINGATDDRQTRSRFIGKIYLKFHFLRKHHLRKQSRFFSLRGSIDWLADKTGQVVIVV